MQTVNSNLDNLSSASDIIDALQNILRSQAFMPDLDTLYSRPSVQNIDHPTIDPELNSKISAIPIDERQQQLDTVLGDISGLETVMNGIQNFHQQLVERKEKIIQSMTVHKELEPAIWRLPTEVLSQIFHCCLPEDQYLSPAPNLAPMLLTRICRPWRDVAVDMPSLWCRLHVKIDIGQEENEETLIAWQRATFFYDSWLKRSRGHPLSLVLERYLSTRLLRSLLQPYSNQISFLSIKFSRRAGQLELLLKNVPALRELVILGMNSFDIRYVAQSISQLPSTMRVLEIMDSPFDVIDSPFDALHIYSLNPVWAHLTQVKITLLHASAFLHLLRLCPNLSSLTVVAAFFHQRALVLFTHTSIQSLLLIDCNDLGMIPNPLGDLFDALSLPNLRVLEARCSYHSPWPHEQLRDLFARSKCPLERLIFSNCMTEMDVPRAEYVALIPSLDVVVNV
ncbi:hypothetical protein F4604DRAFT_2009713 [Suillus subluteus]|nr:hypothetical protein F4604DRAFT_2009713 [Suillus subluteus]